LQHSTRRREACRAFSASAHALREGHGHGRGEKRYEGEDEIEERGSDIESEGGRGESVDVSAVTYDLMPAKYKL
jgi:hypothetical protein